MRRRLESLHSSIRRGFQEHFKSGWPRGLSFDTNLSRAPSFHLGWHGPAPRVPKWSVWFWSQDYFKQFPMINMSSAQVMGFRESWILARLRADMMYLLDR